MAFDLEVDAVFDAAHLTESLSAHRRVAKFNHEGRFPVGAIGNKRVVSFKFFLDASNLKNLLDTKHFLDLIADGKRIFEVDASVFPEGKLARFLVCKHFSAEAFALFRVLL